MDCPYPRYRINWKSPSARVYFASYENRVHNDGILINRDEYHYLRDFKNIPFFDSYVDKVPCGQCYACRRKKAFDWANRLSLEAKTCDEKGQECWFATLTYATDSLRFAPYYVPETGEVEMRMSIVMQDISDFMKRLRREWEYHYHHVGIRFFGVSEYGSVYLRPHFHVLLFNFPVKDLQRLPERTKSGAIQYTSPKLEQAWGNGFVSLGRVNWESCAYCAGYCYKKLTGESKQIVDRFNAETSPDDLYRSWIENLDVDNVDDPDFVFTGFENPYVKGWKISHSGAPIYDPDDCLMLPKIPPDKVVPYGLESSRCSRMPGIGFDYYSENMDRIYEHDQMNVKKKGKIVPVKPAAYYDRLFDVEHHERLFDLKTKRKEVAEGNFKNVLRQNGWTEDFYYDNARTIMEEEKKRALNFRQLE